MALPGGSSKRTYVDAVKSVKSQSGKNVGGTTSVTRKKTMEDSSIQDARKEAILKKLDKTDLESYSIDFHHYTCSKALKELEDIIISLKHNMKGESKQVIIITGKGFHSLNKKSALKDAVLNYCRENHIKYEVLKDNPGRTKITVWKIGGIKYHF